MKSTPWCLALLTALTASVPSVAESLRVYFIGNSLTASTTLDRVHGLCAQRGIDLQFGAQLSAGKSLARHLDYAREPDQKWHVWETSRPSNGTYLPHDNFYVEKPENWRFGRYDAALANHIWDALVLQPFVSPLAEDLRAADAFIRLARARHPATEVFIYATWPRRPRAPAARAGGSANDGAALDIDYPVLWTAPYAFGEDDATPRAAAGSASRDYYHRLVNLLRARHPDGPPIRLIPAGEVLCAIDTLIKADELPGLRELAAREPDQLPGLGPGGVFDRSRGVNLLYADPVHLNSLPHRAGTVGIFLSGTTLFAVLTGRSPVGLDGSSYGFDPQLDAALVRAIQETIWRIVTADPLTGLAR